MVTGGAAIVLAGAGYVLANAGLPQRLPPRARGGAVRRSAFVCPPARDALAGTIPVDLSAAFCAYPEPWRLSVDRNHPSMTANRAVIAPALADVLAGRRGDEASAAGNR